MLCQGIWQGKNTWLSVLGAGGAQAKLKGFGAAQPMVGSGRVGCGWVGCVPFFCVALFRVKYFLVFGGASKADQGGCDGLWGLSRMPGPREDVRAGVSMGFSYVAGFWRRKNLRRQIKSGVWWPTLLKHHGGHIPHLCKSFDAQKGFFFAERQSRARQRRR